MGQVALSLGGNTFQFFTRNPRGSQAKAWDRQDIAAYTHLAQTNHFAPILAHAPYTLNPAAAQKETREFAEIILRDDLHRMTLIPGNMYNLHPGSHVGQGIKAGITLIANVLNHVITPNLSTTVLLETMSGKGSEIGSTFEELQAVIERVSYSDTIGVCWDTCHLFAAGYDIVNRLDDVVADFDKIVGLSRLKTVHLNDSLMPFSSHKDRHAAIGKGYIGQAALERVINHPALKHLPFYLETPQDHISGYAREIQMLRAAYRK